MKAESKANARKHILVDLLQRHAIDPPMTNFSPPPVPNALWFTPAQLALSVARNLALAPATPELLDALAGGALGLIEALMEDEAKLTVSTSVATLGDAALNHFSHDLAAGVGGLLMEAMGFNWRANGKELLTGENQKPDYVWSRGLPHEVVLSEVKGATSPNVSRMRLNRRAEKGFEEQVCPWLGETTNDGVPIRWGYGIGIHAPGGGESGCVIHEPEQRSNVSWDGDVFVPLEIARRDYAAIFRLMGCFEIADALTYREGSRLPTRVPFHVIEQHGVRLMLPAESRRRSIADRIFGRRWRIAIAEQSANAILGYQTDAAPGPDIALVRPVRQSDERGLPIAPDGLALVRSRNDAIGFRVWYRDGGYFGRLADD